ncbi:tetratricopeptide repeat protein [candidate division TA06 bacterium]|uniref:Tetratricopeptide repeat protein n=1 Tax=candidate division TA06 bacterium TaxID=2250710 RepID=A0A933I9Q5_UNCT6|nr:tetratricopeptide repeat protein [candidate division TA06 bacterium]
MNKKYLRIILILALTVIAYWPIFSADFMYDDRFFVQENPGIREWRNLPEYFASHSSSIAAIKWEGIWRPLRTVSYLVDYKIWGLNPLGFHLTNLLWHLLNVVILYLLLSRLFKNENLSLAACLIFALHPIQTEAVTWISSRGDLMFLSCGLTAFILFMSYEESRKHWALGLSCFSFILALLSKETAIVLPALFILYRYIFTGKGNIRETISRWKPDTVYFLIIAVYFVLRRLALGMVSQCPYWGDSFWTNLFTMIRVALDYVRLLFLPLWLRVDYVYDLSTNILDWRIIGSLGILTMITAFAIRDLKNKGFLAFGWFWFVIGLLPVSNIFPITTLLAERFLYLPLIGFAIWAGYLWSSLGNRKLAAAILWLILPAMMALTIKRNMEWRSPLKLWTAETARSQNSFIAHDYLGNLYYQNGNLPSAEREFLRALEIDPTYVNSLYGLALVYVQWQKYDRAIIYARKNLSLDPYHHGAWVALGISYGGKGDLFKSEQAFKQAVSIEPGSREGWANLGIIYAQQMIWKKAVDAYSKAVAVDPGDYSLYNDLALALSRQGDATRALDIWQKVLALSPDHLESRMNLAQALEKTDPVRAAVQWELFLETAQKFGQPVNREFVTRRIKALRKNEKE